MSAGLKKRIEALQALANNVASEAQDEYYEMSETQQGSDKGQVLYDVVDHLDTARDAVDCIKLP